MHDVIFLCEFYKDFANQVPLFVFIFFFTSQDFKQTYSQSLQLLLNISFIKNGHLKALDINVIMSQFLKLSSITYIRIKKNFFFPQVEQPTVHFHLFLVPRKRHPHYICNNNNNNNKVYKF